MKPNLENLAEGLTRHLGIPFIPGTAGRITFRGRLRISDWAVPLIFDGHVAREEEGLVPVDMVGHVLWPALRSTAGDGQRPWWYCDLTVHAAEAILDHVTPLEEQPDDRDAWLIGRDVLLERAPQPALGPGERRVA